MDVTITPHELSGQIEAIASKSMAHRLLICAALCPGPTTIRCTTSSKDIEATIACLNALGAEIEREGDLLRVTPLPGTPASDNIRIGTRGTLLDCGESGSTERFMLPVVAALRCAHGPRAPCGKAALAPLRRADRRRLRPHRARHLPAKGFRQAPQRAL